MLKAIWTAAKGFLGSKKGIAAVLTAVGWVAGRFGLHLNTTELGEALSPFLAYILGQGIADHGKSAAEIAAKSGATP